MVGTDPLAIDKNWKNRGIFATEVFDEPRVQEGGGARGFAVPAVDENAGAAYRAGVHGWLIYMVIDRGMSEVMETFVQDDMN